MILKSVVIFILHPLLDLYDILVKGQIHKTFLLKKVSQNFCILHCDRIFTKRSIPTVCFALTGINLLT